MRRLSSGTLRDAFSRIQKLDTIDFGERSLMPVGAIQARLWL